MSKSIKIKEIAILAVIIALIGTMIYYAVDFMRFPEQYATTLKYKLQLDIENGNEKAIEYYNDTYIANGRVLFD